MAYPRSSMYNPSVPYLIPPSTQTHILSLSIDNTLFSFDVEIKVSVVSATVLNECCDPSAFPPLIFNTLALNSSIVVG